MDQVYQTERRLCWEIKMNRSKKCVLLCFSKNLLTCPRNVAHLIKGLDRETLFTDGWPGHHWYEAFLRRHPEISIRVAQNLSKSRASEDILRGWFKEVEQHLTEKQLINIDGARVFNFDESVFYLCPKGERVLVKKGDKAVYNFTQNDEKERLMVLFMTNAVGTLVPPMIIFPYERIPYSISQSVPLVGVSESQKVDG